MIDQIFRVTIDGVVRTSSVETANITEGIRVYQVATFDFDITDDFTPVTELDIIIEYGDKIFNGFIYEVSRVSKGMLYIECRSYSAMLTEPYHSTNDSQIEDSTTSHGLCSEYATRYGIPINITAVDIDFGGNFEREGTPLAALSSIASTTGAEIWWDGTTLQIQPNKAIKESGRVISDYEIFDFIPKRNPIYQRGVKYVVVDATVSVSSSKDSYYPSQNTLSAKCSVDLDGCDGLVSAAIVPYTSYLRAEGASLRLVNKPLVFSTNMSPSKIVSVDAHIKSITKVTLNGSEITGYSKNYNVLTFSSEKRGMIVVEYIGYIYEGYAKIDNSQGGRYVEFDIYYNQDDRYSKQGYLQCNDYDKGNYTKDGRYDGIDSNGDDIKITTPKDMNYYKGFEVQTQGGDPTFSFYADSDQFKPSIITTQKNISCLDAGRLNARDSGDFVHQLECEPSSLEGVTSSGVDITSQTHLEGSLVVFDKDYKNVSISYTSDVDNHYVKFDADSDKIITMDISGNEFILNGFDSDDMDTAPCILGATVPVNMVYELGESLENVKGKQVEVSYPSGTTTMLTVNGMGMIYIPNIENGDHDINISSISSTAKMILVSGAE